MCFEKRHYCTHVKKLKLLDPNLICYLIEGINKNENVHYYSDRFDSKNILNSLAWTENQKVQITKALTNGQLKVFSAEKVYLDKGFFNIKNRLRDAELAIEDSLKKGYTGLRVVGEMQWIQKALNENISELVADYEYKCNSLFEAGYLTSFCVYCDEVLPSNICFENFNSHPQLLVINSAGTWLFANPLISSVEDKAAHIQNMDNWLRYLRSLGIHWMAQVNGSTKVKFKNQVYGELIRYLEKDRFSHKGIPELFLNLNTLIDS